MSASAAGRRPRARRRRLASALTRLFRHQYWAIGVVSASIEAFVDPDFAPVVDWFPTAPGVFRADPFFLAWGDRRYVIFEEYDLASGKGAIVAAEWLGGTRLVSPRTVIEAPHHLSYPFTFAHDGRLFTTPEAHATDEIPLYEVVAGEMDAVPTWVARAPLVRGLPFSDPTLLRHEGRWWLFTTPADSGPGADLLVHFADALDGPWRAYPHNPVKSALRGARPAGTPFRHRGALYRPAQDSSRTYGGGVVVHRIERLTPEDGLEEVAVATIRPSAGGPYPKGLHTLSAAGDVTLVDGRRDVFVLAEFRRRLTRHLRARWSVS